MNTYEKDDNRGMNQAAWFAKADIDARAEAAYNQHTQFFEDQKHKNRVALAVQLAKGAARLYKAVYETARDSKAGPFTEVKLDKVMFARGARDQLAETLLAFGFLEGEFEYQKTSESFRIFVK